MELNHVRRGSGEPLLLIHGLGATATMWAPVLDRLAAERDVLAVDMPGFGRSPELPAGRRATPANLARAVADFAASQGLERPHVVGNSLGGWVALEIGKAGDASGVLALSPAGLFKRPLGDRPGTARKVGQTLRPLLPAVMSVKPMREALIRTSLNRPDRLTKEEATDLIAAWLDSPGYAAANHEMRSAVFEHGELVGVPVTIAWGEADRLLGPPEPSRMPPGTDYLTLPGAGHVPTWDEPELVAGLILRTSGGSKADEPVETTESEPVEVDLEAHDTVGGAENDVPGEAPERVASPDRDA
ncbi:alpha/beta fold hydrolase [Thermoleophilia bacterium SCSIO 60948]|nr:alpha/beta fold hydrolase [Thermoleophilia bacterium SCSIO 60948]